MMPRIGRPKRYTYRLTAGYGRLNEGRPEGSRPFKPELSPAKMLKLGVFEGKYITDARNEFPREWFVGAKESVTPDPSINCFGVKSRQSWGYWHDRGWIPQTRDDPDVRGWFQWYCRYYMGRRIPALDEIQIARWRSFARHRAQVHADEVRKRITTRKQKMEHRKKQRQALLQWAYDPFK